MGCKPGIFYGQCSELCGVGHAFMPIVVEVVHPNVWSDFLMEKGTKISIEQEHFDVDWKQEYYDLQQKLLNHIYKNKHIFFLSEQ